MDLNALAVFERVAATGSFTAAAHHFHRAVSSISRQIRALEESVGQPLLYRHTRAVTLTEAGRRYYEEVRDILERLDMATEALDQPQAEPSGVLRINAPAAFGQHQIVPLLCDFQLRYPGIKAELFLNDRVVDPVREGHDVTFRVGNLSDSSLVARRLAPMNYVVAASPGYLATRGRPETPEALLEHDCLIYEGEFGRQRWYFQQGGAAEVAFEVNGRLASNDADSLLRAAVLGQGLILFPTWLVAGELARGTLLEVLQPWRCEVMPGRRELYVMTRERRLSTRKVQAFMEYLFETVSPIPPWDRWQDSL
ncbi:LysR family transcriptional regulator [Halopseudomonas nanhaiensis]|uniref:LysR family transcriptional regulator n=1 Tax=Halopseudomonas nanhaiensis TaxID=2830842 RepID=UPI001CBCA3CD|nr:LysR family transcriptional regulator [Halopseudomonas nanhaiensis]UAW99911.1 LysR family transcriptional regulator [Halopseudomonas nanhaiensis]